MSRVVNVNGRCVGAGCPTLIVAEMSANHHQSLDEAIRIVESIKESGADAVKLQTYTPDTITLRSSRDLFRIQDGTLWDNRSFYDLYNEAYTPWEWQPRLKKIAEDLGLV